MEYVIGIDVGTGSVRGALVDRNGDIKKISIQNITTWNPKPGFYQQSSSEIWFACCQVTKKLMENIFPENVKGLSFDATSSIVVCDDKGNSVSVDFDVYTGNYKLFVFHLENITPRSKKKLHINDDRDLDAILIDRKERRKERKPMTPIIRKKALSSEPKYNKGDNNNQDVILWMDRRAETEAAIIDKTEHPILKYVGGKISPEWMIPKILWLKHNHPECWKRAAYIFLLPDFLTWKATGKDSRSLCSVACSCNYEISTDGDTGWVKSYFDAIGLEELAENNWKKIGSKILNPGELCGGLNPKPAEETGLLVGTAVATAIIDGQCGGLGVIGSNAPSVSTDLTSKLALVCGTSTNHVYNSNEQFFVTGVRGPYFGAVLSDLWLLIAGQSVSGKLIDHIVNTHPAAKLIREKYPNKMVTEYLNDILHKISKNMGLNSFDELTKDLHIYPDFHGNRTPLADPYSRGMMLGLTLETDENNLARWYLATVQALTYSTRYIIEELQRQSTNNTKIESVLICGGLSKNKIFVQTHANAIGLSVLLPEKTESVLLGSAMLAAVASDFYPDLKTATLGMAGSAKQINADSSVEEFHNKKYKAYFELLKSQKKIRKIMQT